MCTSNRYQVGLQSCSLKRCRDVRALAAKLKELGFRYVELSPDHLSREVSQIGLKEVLAALRYSGIEVTSWGVFRVGSNEAEDRRLFALARLAGMEAIGVETAPGSLQGLEELAGEYGIKLAICPFYSGYPLGTVETLSRSLQGAGPALGLCLDTMGALKGEWDPCAFLDLFQNELLGVHLRDAARDPDGNWKEVPLGRGSLELSTFLSKLEHSGFQGYLSLGYEGEAGDHAAGIEESLNSYRKAASG